MLIVFLSTLQIIGMPVTSEYLCQLIAGHCEFISLDWQTKTKREIFLLFIPVFKWQGLTSDLELILSFKGDQVTRVLRQRFI